MPRKTSKNNTTELSHSLFAARSFVGSFFFWQWRIYQRLPKNDRPAKTAKNPGTWAAAASRVSPPVAGFLIPGAALLAENF